MSAELTVALMREFAPSPSKDSLDRVGATTREQVAAVVSGLGFSLAETSEVASTWDTFRVDEGWVTLLASLVTMIEAQRGDVDATIPIWDDLADAGPPGRLFYFYLYVLCAAGTIHFLEAANCRADVIDSTMATLRRLAVIHDRKWHTLGVDPGWWLIPILRGELLRVGSLEFHRVNLGVGTLSPDPWYSEEEVDALGVGFRRGDPSLGIHIPEGTAFDPASLDATFALAREVLGAMWPVDARRLATCQSWILDRQLIDYLGPTSNVLAFQRRFHLLPRCEPIGTDPNTEILEFVFRAPGVALTDLPRDTTLERAVLDHIAQGKRWRLQPGWLDFDGR
jgi:hypothetical protein